MTSLNATCCGDAGAWYPLLRVRAVLAGKTVFTAGQDLKVAHSLPHGHVAAVAAQAKNLRLPELLGPAGQERDLALALIIARVVRPGPQLATTNWWADTTLAADFGVADATTDEVCAAMDWLAEHQDRIEAKLARRHLEDAEANPHRLAMFDLSSSWMTGTHCPPPSTRFASGGWCTLPAFVELLQPRGYRLVGKERKCFNAVFLRDDVGRDHFPEIPAAECFDHPMAQYRIEYLRDHRASLPDMWVSV